MALLLLLVAVDPGVWFCSQNIHEEPIHILNVALRWADHAEDEKLVPIFRAFAQSKVCHWGWTPLLQTLQNPAPHSSHLGFVCSLSGEVFKLL